MRDYSSIYDLNVYTLYDSEMKVLVMTDIPNSEIFDGLVNEFRELTGYNNKEFNKGYDYTVEELEEFLVKKGYFIYTPQSGSYINF